MADAISIQELIDARTDAKTLEEAVNGDAVTTVLSRLGETYPTLSNALNQIDSKLDSADAQIKQAITDLFQNGGLPATPFATKALMEASELVDGDYAMVTDDTVNNGLYVKTAGAWVKSGYDPVAQAKSYTDSKNNLKVDGVKSKNLFNKNEVTSGFIDGNGALVNSNDYSKSDYLPVLASAVYSATQVYNVAFYNAAKSFIISINGSQENMIAPIDAAFARVSLANNQLNAAQLEQNATRTTYQAYGAQLGAGYVDTTRIKDAAVTTNKLAPLSINNELLNGAVWLNMHDKTKLLKNKSIGANGAIVDSEGTDVTEAIVCKPNTVYSIEETRFVEFYRADMSHISGVVARTFTTPANCSYFRYPVASFLSDRIQANEGAVSLATVPPAPHKFTLPALSKEALTKQEVVDVYSRKYTFNDAWIAWRKGEKFPICFLGDSTIEGYGTSGHIARPVPYDFTIDYNGAPNSYVTLFQALVREATGNNVMRAYNAGFGGQGSIFAHDNIDAIMDNAYADSKLVGLGHGINDRSANFSAHVDFFRNYTELTIKKLLAKGMQPFMITTQPITMPSQVDTSGSASVIEASNSVKKQLAEKYNLEIVDVNSLAEQFMRYSSKPLLNNIMENNSNTIHFGNAGHKFTAGLMFATFNPLVIWVNNYEQLDFITQRIKSDMDYSDLNQLATSKEGFKNEVLKTQSTATNKLYQQYHVFNISRKPLSLTAYYASAVAGQYVVVDGVQTVITSQAQNIGEIDLGLHKIAAYSSATNTLDWLGFKLTPTV